MSFLFPNIFEFPFFFYTGPSTGRMDANGIGFFLLWCFLASLSLWLRGLGHFLYFLLILASIRSGSSLGQNIY